MTDATGQEFVLERKIRFWLRAVYFSAAAVAIPPLIGLMGTVLGMILAFRELGAGEAADPGFLAGKISASMKATAIGLSISFLGLVFLIISILQWRRFRGRV